MKNYKLKILFVIANNRSRKNGTVPLFCRLTYNKKRKQFATGQFINPTYWNSKKQLAEPPDDENDYLNNQLSLIKTKINRVFLLLQLKELEFDVDDIYNQFLGKTLIAEKTLLDAFDYHINRMQKLVGIDVKQVSVEKFEQTLKHIKTFLKFKYHKNDYLLKDLKLQFLNEFEYYLKVEKKFLPNTVYKSLQRTRWVVRVSVGADYLVKDPFILHKARKPKTKVIFLTTKELKKLEKHQFAQPRLGQVRDWFIFSCYTGLAYNEIKNLKKQYIVKGFDGLFWIQMKLEKTQKNIAVPILPKALKLLNKYNKSNSDVIFQIVCNQRYNSYLKEIATIVGIEKKTY